MNAVIEGFLIQLLAIDQDLPGIAAGLTPLQFNWNPTPERWSIGQCTEHLNITTERYIPVLRKAASEARAAGKLADGPYALGFFERWFLQGMEPPPRRRFRTRPSFVAAANLDPAATVERFTRLNAELGKCIREAEGLDLRSIKVRSQFGPISWSMNATFAILLAHERRHIWQVREVRTSPGFPAA